MQLADGTVDFAYFLADCSKATFGYSHSVSSVVDVYDASAL